MTRSHYVPELASISAQVSLNLVITSGHSQTESAPPVSTLLTAEIQCTVGFIFGPVSFFAQVSFNSVITIDLETADASILSCSSIMLALTADSNFVIDISIRCFSFHVSYHLSISEKTTLTPLLRLDQMSGLPSVSAPRGFVWFQILLGWLLLFGLVIEALGQPSSPLFVSCVVTLAMRGSKIGIFPQLAISFVKAQFAPENLFGEDFHRRDVVDVRSFSIVDKRL